ncbi:MAG: magnesium transporter CorA family protein, partial [Oscillospiraceae bacterium]|nr:magnesium transporter CorA family protein [Oscillospiraceae bacterium]
MLKYYKTVNNRLEELDDIEDGCWIEATAPTEAEISKLEHELSVDRDFIRAALDEEETSRIENEEGQVLIVLDYPVAERAVKAESKQRRSRFKKNRNADNEPFTYYTVPMGIIHTSNNVITVSLKSNPILEDFAHGVVKGFRTDFRTQFTFHILLRVAGKYLQYLKQIDKLSGLIESRLLSSMHNKEL